MDYKKAIVTGGAGFIGSHIAEELVKMGIETISIDNYSAGTKENLAHLHAYPNFTEIECDVLDYDKLNEYMDGVDLVYHEAVSRKTVCLKDPRLDLDINAKGTLNMLELARLHKVKKYMHASTGSVYGECIMPLQDETHPLNPSTHYGVSKLCGERYAQAYHQMYGMDITILRYYNVYGPRQDWSAEGGIVSIYIKKMLTGEPLTMFGDGSQERTFTYIKDVVNANLLGAGTPGTAGEAYNCSSGVTITIKELYNMLCDIMGMPDYPLIMKEGLIGETMHMVVDNSKIKRDLHMPDMTTMAHGLGKTVAWLKENQHRFK